MWIFFILQNLPFPKSEDLQKISTELAGKSEEIKTFYEWLIINEKSQNHMLKQMSFFTVMGNKFASNGRFDVAVKYFTDAIKYNPKEYR